jgi:hypothetical protein
VSPFKGYGATLALIFVLTAAAVKAIIEDRKRHKEDHKTNNSTATIMQKDGCASLGVLAVDCRHCCCHLCTCHRVCRALVVAWECYIIQAALVEAQFVACIREYRSVACSHWPSCMKRVRSPGI